jgi:L-lactate dehydrogenase complex protein LldF
MSVRVGKAAEAPTFAQAARGMLGNAQLRHNVRHATDVIRARRAHAVGETPDWQQLRDSARAIKDHVLRHLDTYLEQFETACTAAGGKVHWARDADEANTAIVDIIRSHGGTEVIKVKTMTSDETGLNPALEAAGITPIETDLADLIIQLGSDKPSHIVVPALHRNKAEIRRLFMDKMQLPELGERAEDLAGAARRYLRERFLRVPVGLSGANFAIAESGSLCVVESEGNGRMCVSLPKVLVSLVGIEKIIPTFGDLEVFLQLLGRSATGERMNPYNSIWSGVTAGDGPAEFHVVLLDNGRTGVLDGAGDAAPRWRASAAAPASTFVRSTGRRAATPTARFTPDRSAPFVTPQLQSMKHSQSLPFASTLCGACYDVCPVKIDIPEILLYLRNKVVKGHGAPWGERLAMRFAAGAFKNGGRLEIGAETGADRAEAVRSLGLDRAAAGDAQGTGRASATWPRCRPNRSASGGRRARTKESEMSAAQLDSRARRSWGEFARPSAAPAIGARSSTRRFRASTGAKAPWRRKRRWSYSQRGCTITAPACTAARRHRSPTPWRRRSARGAAPASWLRMACRRAGYRRISNSSRTTGSAMPRSMRAMAC